MDWLVDSVKDWVNSLLYVTGASLFPWLDSSMLLQDLLLYQNSVLSLERVKRIDTVFLLARSGCFRSWNVV